MQTQNHRKKNFERKGAAMVEAGLVLPIFFVVVFAIVEFGRAFMVCQLMTNAAREGARLAVVTGVTNAEVESYVADIVSRTVGVDLTEVTITITVTAHPGNPNPGNILTNANKRDLCEVEASVLYDDVSFVPMRYLSGIDIVGQAAMRHE